MGVTNELAPKSPRQGSVEATHKVRHRRAGRPEGILTAGAAAARADCARSP
jgi:hypothetical protein